MPAAPIKNHLEKLLAKGNRELSTTLAVLARIEGNDYELIAVKSNSGAFVAGEHYQLGNCFCREVFETGKTIARTNIDNSSNVLNHPLYRSLPLECYIGARVSHQGKAWGSLNFSNMAQHLPDFAKADIEMVESLAKQISNLLDAAK